MNLQFDVSATRGYKSKSQIVRVLTEKWVGENIFCPSCGREQLNYFRNNEPVADFFCSDCNSEYELKSKNGPFSFKVVDGAYDSMIERVNADNNPHFFLLSYSSKDFMVENLFVIPKYYFVNDIIEIRKPLSSNAKRAGWIGCNILLNSIPTNGKIFIIHNGKIRPKNEVLKDWSKTSFLAEQIEENRGWTIEVIKIINKISSRKFSLKDVYVFEGDLQKRFPNNNYIRDKLRQQLQILRDKGFIEFMGRGQYSKLD